LDRVEHRLQPWVSFAIVPIFALANAGLVISGSDLRTALTSEVAAGITIGLVVGKPLGILVASWVAVRIRVADLPEGIGWRHVLGAGILGGIGFTVSLFMTRLALEPEQQIVNAKLGIFAASIVSGLVGVGFLWLVGRRQLLMSSRGPVEA
jgi:NhaA family Na+:H+ antiporter